MEILTKILALLLLASPASADCLKPAQRAKILSTYSFKTWVPGTSISAPILVDATMGQGCDDEGIFGKTLQAIAFLDKAYISERGNFPLRFIDQDPAKFFSRRVKKIVFENELHKPGCKDDNVIAFVEPDSTDTMHICSIANKANTLEFSTYLMHESRHIDAEAPEHVLCKHGVNEGMFSKACDESLGAGGAYEVQVEFNVLLSHSPRLSEKERAETRGYALALLLENFNELPLGIRAGVMLLSDKGDISFYTGKSEFPLLKGIAESAIVTLRHSIVTLFDRASGSVGAFLGDDTFVDGMGSLADMFSAFSPEERAKILDIRYGGRSCVLFSTHILCYQSLENFVDLELPKDIVPSHLMGIPGVPGGDAIFVATKDQRLIQISQNALIQEWVPENFREETVLNRFAFNIALPDRNHFALSHEGDFLRPPKAGERGWQIVNGFEGRRFKKILGPAYWSESLKTL